MLNVTVVYMSFCSWIKGITPKMCMLCFVLTNSVLLNLVCVENGTVPHPFDDHALYLTRYVQRLASRAYALACSSPQTLELIIYHSGGSSYRGKL